MILKYQVTFVTRKVEKKITKNKLILLAREKKMAQNTKKIQKVTRKVEKKITKNKLILLAREKKDGAKYQEDTKSNQNNIVLATSKNACVSFITLSIHLFDL